MLEGGCWEVDLTTQAVTRFDHSGRYANDRCAGHGIVVWIWKTDLTTEDVRPRRVHHWAHRLLDHPPQGSKVTYGWFRNSSW